MSRRVQKMVQKAKLNQHRSKMQMTSDKFPPFKRKEVEKDLLHQSQQKFNMCAIMEVLIMSR